MLNAARHVWLVLPCWFMAVRLLAADDFQLTTGGVVRGTWLNRATYTPSTYELQTSSGIRLLVPREVVTNRVRRANAETEYERIAPNFSQTVTDQWKLAEWCRGQGLKEARKWHLETILELDPHHVAARRLLGYRQVSGKWIANDDYLRDSGYLKDDGRWTTSQDAQLQEEKRELAEKERAWLLQLKRMRKDLNGRKSAEAYAEWEAVKDPLARAGILWLWDREPELRCKLLYLDVLARIDDTAARQALLRITLQDANQQIFLEGADRVTRIPPHVWETSLLEALRSSNNNVVNRAAYLANKMKLYATVAPLIEVLVTRHVTSTGASGDQTTTSFGSDGSMALGRGAPAAVEVNVQNRDVLEALVELTGENFQYNQTAWRAWYNNHREDLAKRAGR